MGKLVSIDLEADFGFLRKPDTNDGITMSYNMLHKPALLGIFGAILGLEGYQRRGLLPEYYQQLQSLKTGIAPLGDDNGNFAKTTIVYTNTVGYANKDGNFIAYENTLIKPSYRVFIALSDSHPLHEYLKKGKAEYIPYLGKNEFPVWWTNFREYPLKELEAGADFEVKTLFLKKDVVNIKKEKKASSVHDFFSSLSNSFFYFERLPVGFQEYETRRGKEFQYELKPFTYTNARFGPSHPLLTEHLFEISKGEVVQLN